MKVVVFASAKGGVGKTTLAFNCAIYAALTGRSVYLVDRDPVEALTRICKRRQSDGDLDPDNPERLEGLASVGHAIGELKRLGFERDFLIVDTPNAFVPIIRDAIACADCVVLPIEASPIDIEVNESAVEEVEKLGKREFSLYVVNPADARTALTREAKQLVAKLSPHEPITIAQRQDYRRSLITGQAAVEINDDAKREIGKLWKAILKVMGEDYEGAKPAQHDKRASQRQ
jgi:chromosome partitioning protein